jgi:hypothetical protein
VLLPDSFQIDQANLGNLCSEAQLAANRCAGRNTIGRATATTPLLGSTLSGPVYAVSGSGGLPRLAVILRGGPADPVELVIRGDTTTEGARIRNTFPLVPDAPITDFALTIDGGTTGYLVNNRDLCTKTKRVARKGKRKGKRPRRVPTSQVFDVAFTAQTDATLAEQPRLFGPCAQKKKGGGKGKQPKKRSRKR